MFDRKYIHNKTDYLARSKILAKITSAGSALYFRVLRRVRIAS